MLITKLHCYVTIMFILKLLLNNFIKCNNTRTFPDFIITIQNFKYNNTENELKIIKDLCMSQWISTLSIFQRENANFQTAHWLHCTEF